VTRVMDRPSRAMPVLSAALEPPFRWRMTKMRGSWKVEMRSPVASEEPSSTTMSSKSRRVWARTERGADWIVSAALYAGTTTVNVG
jgi:hypothetical protein